MDINKFKGEEEDLEEVVNPVETNQKEESEKGQSKPVSINNNIMPQNQEKKNKKEFNDLHTEISNQIFKNKELDIKTYIMSRNKKKEKEIIQKKNKLQKDYL